MGFVTSNEILRTNCNSCWELRNWLESDKDTTTLAIEYKRAKVHAMLVEKIATEGDLCKLLMLPASNTTRLKSTRLEMFDDGKTFNDATEIRDLPDEELKKIFKNKKIPEAIKKRKEIIKHCNSCFENLDDNEKAAEHRQKFLEESKKKVL